MKNIILVFAALLFVVGGNAKDFVEAQMNYNVSADGKKQYLVEWDEDSSTAKISMGFSWQNFRDDWHLGGFDISTAASAYIVFPELVGNCKLINNYTGEFNGEETSTDNYVKMMIKGSDCKNSLKYFELYGVVISFYKVQALVNKEKTRVLRLYVTDTPHL